ncbi:MAG TPA: LEA type 2 family protein [Kofleriaceae bacterium]|jgi:LEA14-like dessication related protein|nr:LEA type 2 family protein [Kofleriaceae bacterium]
MRSIVMFLVCTQALACSLFLHSIERPQAKVRDVSVSSAGLTGVTGQLVLDVSNPNNVGVPLSGIDWQLSVGGVRAVTGRVELSQTIPARGVVPITTSLAIDARDAIVVGSALASGVRDYQLVAHLHFSTVVGQLDVEVQHGGTLGGGGLWGLR